MAGTMADQFGQMMEAVSRLTQQMSEQMSALQNMMPRVQTMQNQQAALNTQQAQLASRLASAVLFQAMAFEMGVTIAGTGWTSATSSIAPSSLACCLSGTIGATAS